MLLRSYQRRVVDKAKKALKKKGNTLVIGATGMGKTVVMAALAGEVKGKTLILQHRQELVQQNAEKFLKVNPDWRVSMFTAAEKSFGGQAVFSMQQTLCRNLDYIPKFDHVIVDETHHIVAPTYQTIIDACRDRNPDMMLTGLSATPERGDRKSLRKYFDNVADKVTIRELVGLGFLVPPRAFVVDVGAQSELSQLRNLSAFGDQREVQEILDTTKINAEVVRHWREKAGDRKTIVFCSTIQHAIDVADAFRSAGVNTGVVTGDMSDGDRRETIRSFDRGPIQVLVNVAVLTEGFDSQPVSCVILLRQCSEKGPMIQMAGRGLRTVDPEIYPGVVKRDCIVLDFGTSLITHGNLDQDDGLHEEAATDSKGEAVVKVCPSEYRPGMIYHFPDRNGNEGCGGEVPASTRTCPFCGFVFDRVDGKEPEVTEVSLTELDILNASPFRWCDIFSTDTILMASGFSAWAGVVTPDRGETWHAIGKMKDEKKLHHLAITGRLQAMSAADDFMRAMEDSKSAKKSKRWLDEPATEKQAGVLARYGVKLYPDIMGNTGATKYSAACIANFFFNQTAIEKAIGII